MNREREWAETMVETYELGPSASDYADRILSETNMRPSHSKHYRQAIEKAIREAIRDARNYERAKHIINAG